LQLAGLGQITQLLIRDIFRPDLNRHTQATQRCRNSIDARHSASVCLTVYGHLERAQADTEASSRAAICVERNVVIFPSIEVTRRLQASRISADLMSSRGVAGLSQFGLGHVHPLPDVSS
jgi:hypothetical protein